MDHRPVPAKITRPTPGETFPRTRLFKLLDRARRRPLVWVMGPPGAGKTVLLTDYLAQRRLSPLWYQVDAGDSDALMGEKLVGGLLMGRHGASS